MVHAGMILRRPFGPLGLLAGADGQDQVPCFDFTPIRKLDLDAITIDRTRLRAIPDVKVCEPEGLLHLFAVGVEKGKGGTLEGGCEESALAVLRFAGKALKGSMFEAEVMDRRGAQVSAGCRRATACLPSRRRARRVRA